MHWILNTKTIKPYKPVIKKIAINLQLVSSKKLNTKTAVNLHMAAKPTSLFETILALPDFLPESSTRVTGRKLPKDLSAEILRKIQVEAAMGANLVAFSHDNFTTNVGGIQTIMNLEKVAVVTKNGNYWSIHPQNLALSFTSNPNLELWRNGKFVGIFRALLLETLLNQIEQTAHSENQLFRIIVHSLLGHDPGIFQKSISSLSTEEVYFYSHDFYTICPSFKLLRNDLDFCNAPQITSTSCKICVYGKSRADHVQKIEPLLALPKVKLFTPSQSAQAILHSGSNLKTVSSVAPHLRLDPVSSRKDDKNPRARIAFFGPPVTGKGWDDFIALQRELDGYLDFYVFSHVQLSIPGIAFIFLENNFGEINHTRDILLEYNIDYAFIYPRWPETYSLVAAEAISAGVFILTNPNSGNVASLVKEYSAGELFENIDAVVDFLKSDSMVNHPRIIYDCSFIGLVTNDLNSMFGKYGK